MIVGLLFELKAEPGRDDDVARFVEDELADTLEPVPTTVWHGVRFDLLRFGVIAEYDTGISESVHVGSKIAEMIRDQLGDALSEAPTVRSYDILSTGSHAPMTSTEVRS
jgi:hypothetical protein